MAIALGLENKRQVIMASVLLAVVLVCGIVVYRMFSGPSTPPDAGTAPTPQLHQAPAAGDGANPAGNDALKLSNEGIDPTLHFDKLAQSEDVTYSGTGRNIFSADSAPIPLPTPLAPARPNGGPAAQAKNQPPSPPKPPSIDLRYFGYSQDEHKVMEAFFMHGDDIFMARIGDIVDHRFKVDAIHAANVEVTDLAYNNTQTIQISNF